MRVAALRWEHPEQPSERHLTTPGDLEWDAGRVRYEIVSFARFLLWAR
jgi:hypothetical protein